MEAEGHPLTRFSRLMRSGWVALCPVAVMVAFLLPSAKADSLVIPAWSFARGNAQVYANPETYADAGPVVGSGPEPLPLWGCRVEYDIDIPVTARYTFQICYAAGEPRPVWVWFDDQNVGKTCMGVTVKPHPPGTPAEVTWNSSGAKWERFDFVSGSITKGQHRLMLASEGPLPHLVAVLLNTAEAFPNDWKPPRYTVKDLERIPAAYRHTFHPPGGLTMAGLPPVDSTPLPGAAGRLRIDACTFDRGNAQIHANPSTYAAYGRAAAGGGPQAPAEAVVEYDVDIPVAAEYAMRIDYATAEARPTDVWLDNRWVGKGCTLVSAGSVGHTTPITFTSNIRLATSEWLYDPATGGPARLSIAKGKHVLKISRQGPLPNLRELHLETTTPFPDGWKQPERTVDLGRVPPRYRGVFLPPNAVNIAGLRLAVQDAMESFGPRYPEGPQYLKRLSELEAAQSAAGPPSTAADEPRDDALHTLRRTAMLAHPSLDFDKLLFLKRPPAEYGHTYARQGKSTQMGGNLCILSPVAPDGNVTSLVPELDGGLFDRFDLSFDAKKVIFAYKQAPSGSFRLYEIDIDPVAAKMVPGSLRQLTSAAANEAEIIRANTYGGGNPRAGGFDDMDPCYLPDGRIMFTSTRPMEVVFCAPGSTVTTLYVMDADGKNIRRVSKSPLNETAPSVMSDGRVVYTRWEYIDKGLGSGQSLWSMRSDGSGVDHVFKNNMTSPCGMSCARSIPGTGHIVAIAGSHHYAALGSVVLVDNRLGRSTMDALTCLTPGIGYPPQNGPPSTPFGGFTDPYPCSDKVFLVAHREGRSSGADQTHYGICIVDAWCNRTVLYRDPAISCFMPVPLRPRPKPMETAPVGPSPDDAKPATATLFLQDVYEGLTGIERGRVKYIRVMGALAWPWNENGLSWRLGLNADPHRKKVYGVAKVHEDGSACFAVPAHENIFFHALDENFMALQQMPTFINLMPGERRSCVGCHEDRTRPPRIADALPMAGKHPPQALAPQPGDAGPRMIHYASDVQPALDKHCIRCHGGKNAIASLDLTGVPTELWSRSYENLINRGLVNYADCRSGSANFPAVPPLTRGSHRSKLLTHIRREPCRANLTEEEVVRIVTWIDANIPYYGTYAGTRDLAHVDRPDFRPVALDP